MADPELLRGAASRADEDGAEGIGDSVAIVGVDHRQRVDTDETGGICTPDLRSSAEVADDIEGRGVEERQRQILSDDHDGIVDQIE